VEPRWAAAIDFDVALGKASDERLGRRCVLSVEIAVRDAVVWFVPADSVFIVDVATD
jgi:hypothetical protein